MKRYLAVTNALLCAGLLVLSTGCHKDVTEFGNDAETSGKILGPSGAIVSSTITSNTLWVGVLGEGEIVPYDLRVNADGFYQNNKMFPKKIPCVDAGPCGINRYANRGF